MLLPRNELGSKQQLVVAGTFRSGAQVQLSRTRSSEMPAAERAPSVLPKSLRENETLGGHRRTLSQRMVALMVGFSSYDLLDVCPCYMLVPHETDCGKRACMLNTAGCYRFGPSCECLRKRLFKLAA